MPISTFEEDGVACAELQQDLTLRPPASPETFEPKSLGPARAEKVFGVKPWHDLKIHPERHRKESMHIRYRAIQRCRNQRRHRRIRSKHRHQC